MRLAGNSRAKSQPAGTDPSPVWSWHSSNVPFARCFNLRWPTRISLLRDSRATWKFELAEARWARWDASRMEVGAGMAGPALSNFRHYAMRFKLLKDVRLGLMG